MSTWRKGLLLGLLLPVMQVQAGALSSHLQFLQADYQRFVATKPGQVYKPQDVTTQVVNKSQVVVTITVKNQDTETVKNQLQQKGMTQIAQYKHLIPVRFPFPV